MGTVAPAMWTAASPPRDQPHTPYMTAPHPEPDCQLHLAHVADGLRDVYMGGGYRDVILPVTVFRPLDAALHLTKQADLDMKATLHLTDCEPGRRGLLEADRTGRLEGHAPRHPSAGLRAANPGRYRQLSRGIPTQRPGHPRQLRVPLPFPPNGSPMSPQGGFRRRFHTSDESNL